MRDRHRDHFPRRLARQFIGCKLSWQSHRALIHGPDVGLLRSSCVTSFVWALDRGNPKQPTSQTAAKKLTINWMYRITLFLAILHKPHSMLQSTFRLRPGARGSLAVPRCAAKLNCRPRSAPDKRRQVAGTTQSALLPIEYLAPTR